MRSTILAAQQVASSPKPARPRALQLAHAVADDRFGIDCLFQELACGSRAQTAWSAQKSDLISDGAIGPPPDRNPEESADDDTLVVRDGDRIAAHLHCVDQQLLLGDVALPAVAFTDFVVAHAYRQHGCVSALLQAAERRSQLRGQVISLLRTGEPAFYGARGWTVWPRHCFSVACPRNVLASFAERQASANVELLGRQTDVQVRLWRHVELDSLEHLHRVAAPQRFGARRRSESHWRWLASRPICERVYAAVANDPESERDSIIGYAIVKDARILEMVCCCDAEQSPRDHESQGGRAANTWRRVAETLLARVCADAIECGAIEIRYDGPPDCPLHQILKDSGGQLRHVEAEHGIVQMARIPRLVKLFEFLCPMFAARAREAKVARPAELGLMWEEGGAERRLRIGLGARSVKIVADKLGRDCLSGGRNDILQLALGHLSLSKALESQRLTASTSAAARLAEALFPPVAAWRSPLDWE